MDTCHHLGQRIHVFGNSCSGKSTLAASLATALDYPLVELDAINWQPNWVGLNATDPAEFERRIADATNSDRWVVAGSYSRFSQNVFWPRLETLVWLDLPRGQLVARMLRRSWRRWRTKELLWGTNREDFWTQLKFWRGEESLLWWIVTQHERKRRQTLAWQEEKRWRHIRFIRLASARAVDDFAASLPKA
ncbi:MAG: adenylate kinase [Pseudomonadota bacterium]